MENIESQPNFQTPGPIVRKRRGKLGFLLIILLLLGLAAAGYAYYLQTKLSEVKADPQKAAQAETQELLNKLAKLIVLPENEQPTVATVTDPEKLKDQPFFAKAVVGDKVIIFTQAKKAILYDPVGNIIKEVAPVNLGNAAGTETK